MKEMKMTFSEYEKVVAEMRNIGERILYIEYMLNNYNGAIRRSEMEAQLDKLYEREDELTHMIKD